VKLWKSLVLLPLLPVLGCSAAPADDDVGVVASAARGRHRFKADRATGSGGGCRFPGDRGGAADAWVTSNGGDLSIVFTQLGASTKVGPRGRMLLSRCDYAVPLEVPAGHVLTGWTQTVTYGVSKPAGVAAGIRGLSAITGPRNVSFELPDFELRFKKNDVVDIPLDVIPGARESFPESHPRYDRWRKRWCNPARRPDLTYSGTASTWSQRDANGTSPVVIAVDGLDLHLDVQADTEACP